MYVYICIYVYTYIHEGLPSIAQAWVAEAEGYGIGVTRYAGPTRGAAAACCGRVPWACLERTYSVSEET